MGTLLSGSSTRWSSRCSRATSPASRSARHRIPAHHASRRLLAFVNAMAQVHESIWWGRHWGWTIRNMLDGLLYGPLLTGGTSGGSGLDKLGSMPKLRNGKLEHR